MQAQKSLVTMSRPVREFSPRRTITIGADLHRLVAYRDLFAAWTQREVRVRYTQSLMGVAWAIAQPLAMMVIFTIVFSSFVSVASDGLPYPLFSYVALLPWTFFASSISTGIPSLSNNLNLVQKIYFPREILPLASIASAGVDFLVGGVFFVWLILVYGQPLTWQALWLPLILLIQIVFSAGFVLLAASFNVFYRDVKLILPLLLQVWLYATPVIYSANAVPAWASGWYFLNPMAGLIDSYRRVLLQALPPDGLALGLAALISVSTLCVGYLYFKRSEIEFADLI